MLCSKIFKIGRGYKTGTRLSRTSLDNREPVFQLILRYRLEGHHPATVFYWLNNRRRFLYELPGPGFLSSIHGIGYTTGPRLSCIQMSVLQNKHPTTCNLNQVSVIQVKRPNSGADPINTSYL